MHAHWAETFLILPFFFLTKTNGHIFSGETANWIYSLVHFDPLILHWPGSELLVANKFYLLNTEEGSANSYSSLSFLLLPGVADDALVFCSFASWCCFTFVVLGPVFPTPSRQRDLSPITCEQQTTFWTAFPFRFMTAWGLWLCHISSLFLSLASQSCWFDASLNSTQLLLNLPQKWWTKTPAFQGRCRATSPSAGTRALGTYPNLCWGVFVIVVTVKAT